MTYREINDDWLLSHGLFSAMLYDLVTFPFRFAKKRKQSRLRKRAEQAQLLKREARRLRRASEPGPKSPSGSGDETIPARPAES